MALISFAEEESEIFGVRKAILRMILSRTRSRLTDPADIEETRMAETVGAILFDDMNSAQRERLGGAILEAVTQLRAEVSAGKPLEEPVLPGIEERLENLENFLKTRLQPSP
jgi:hypothetical protein